MPKESPYSSLREDMATALINDLSFWNCSPTCSSHQRPAPVQAELSTSSSRPRKSRSTASIESIERAAAVWKTAIDPVTGRTYYYDTVTRKTQWDKPAAVKSLEKQQKREQRKRDEEFFAEMQANILSSLARGELIPNIPRADTTRQGPPQEPLPLPKVRVRTISAMNEHLLLSVNNPSLEEEDSPDEFASQSTSVPPVRAPAGPTPPLEGRPPLPSQRSQRQVQHTYDKLDSLELSPEPTKNKLGSATRSNSSSEDLAGEHLLDGPIMDPTSSSSNGLDRPKLLQNHMRRNTGGTMYIRSTMTNPDVEATIKCVSGVYRAHIVQSLDRKSKHSPVSVNTVHVNLEVFRDDYEYPSKKEPDHVPSLAEIEALYLDMYKRSQMEHDTIIMSLIYVERLIKETNGALTPTVANWKSILFSAMILASKVWDDLSMWNIDFSNVSAASGLSSFSLQRINQLELAVLTSLNFDVKVPASEYAKYYFLIRTMLIRSGLLVDAALPLSKEEAKNLETRTSEYQNKQLLGRSGRRSKSIDWSWFGSQQKQENKTAGPVLKDKVCLEQLVCMDR